jgi:hypothetical protein
VNKHRYDVVVVGAGPAGTAAAIASAREGANTLLIEQCRRPGGAGLAGHHRFLCGLYGTAPVSVEDTLNAGIPREVARLISADSGPALPLRMGRVFVLPCSGERLAALFTILIGAERNLTAGFGCRMTEARLDGNCISELTLEDASGPARVTAEVVIDASGDAAAARACGVPFLPDGPDAPPLAGVTIRVAGLSKSRDPLHLLVPLALARQADAGAIPGCLRYTTFTGVPSGDVGYLRINLPPATPAREDAARRYAALTHDVLRRDVPAFAGSALDESLPIAVLDREGARIEGDVVLSRSDILQARKFGGGVRNAWPIELWTEKSGPQYEYVPDGDFYEIPDNCLVSRFCPNLLAAGRCISATREAAASIRVMGTCLALGQASASMAIRLL